MDKIFMTDTVQKRPLGEVIEKGEAIYARVKDQYEPAFRGKFLAIDIESAEIFMGDTLGDAFDRGLEKYPDTSFYLARVGYDHVGML